MKTWRDIGREPRAAALHGCRERTSGNKYNKGSDGAYDAEWTKSDVSVEQIGKMETTEIKRERRFCRDGEGGKKKKGEKKSLGAVYEGKNCVK